MKNIKLKMINDGSHVLTGFENRIYNSPWNIAADFKVDLSFSPEEISTMLVDYRDEQLDAERNKWGGLKTSKEVRQRIQDMDIMALSNELYKYTSGYPFLVSKLCKLIDEKLEGEWTNLGVEKAVKMLLNEQNTLFDDIGKNLENSRELYDLLYNILINGEKTAYKRMNPTIDLGSVLGILEDRNGYVAVANELFELLIYDYMISKKETRGDHFISAKYGGDFVENGRLHMELVLTKFQQFMKEEYREQDENFIEKQGRLLFLSFLKPIINGKGFYFVEAETRSNKRMDIIVTYGCEQFIVELKIWHGESAWEKALMQLVDYLKIKNEEKGYLLTFSFVSNKTYTAEWHNAKGKEIFSVVV
ncbi:MAG: GxxExxY protein [Anaerovorax sp.]